MIQKINDIPVRIPNKLVDQKDKIIQFLAKVLDDQTEPNKIKKVKVWQTKSGDIACLPIHQ